MLPEPFSKQSFLEQRDGATTEISITAGYVLAEDSSPKKLKKARRIRRRGKLALKGFVYVCIEPPFSYLSSQHRLRQTAMEWMHHFLHID